MSPEMEKLLEEASLLYQKIPVEGRSPSLRRVHVALSELYEKASTQGVDELAASIEGLEESDDGTT